MVVEGVKKKGDAYYMNNMKASTQKCLKSFLENSMNFCCFSISVEVEILLLFDTKRA